MAPAQNSSLLRALAAELKARRAALKMSQDELAHRSGLNRTFVGKIEIAKNQPTLTALLKLSDGLDVSPVELLTGVMGRYEKEIGTPKNTKT